MMKKLNKKVIFLSFVLTAILLFGGWFTYQYYGAEKPIEDKIADIKGTTLVEFNSNQQQVELTLSFENQPQFGRELLRILHFVEQNHKGKEVSLSVVAEQGVNHPWWLQHSAKITEALYQKKYSQIESTIKEWKENGLITDGNVMMNQEHLFIYIDPIEDAEVYIYIPLTWE